MAVELVEEFSEELLEAFSRLIPQLSSSAQALNAQQIKEFCEQEGVYLLVFRSEEGKILGMLSLATFKIPTGKRAWIEDVVVDSAARGQGAGQALVEAAVRHAKKVGAKTLDLTSRPTREAANRLYRRCGFKQRQTNVYRYADN
ncbi:N-acetyltransferase [uncultured Varibaculum sp.]|uniref:GNAT family N-acetyltransferase n=1 Tax=uncultured Varibaculum sp. TaxID=413896 RepID=UPI002674F08E|nr:GNAT family N-acetyltransferase [uncultured Varibaculum sp.]